MSSYLDFSITTRTEFKDWILKMLGAPLITVELADEHLEIAINNATEEFTKYCSQERDSIALNIETYTQDVGFTLQNNVTGVYVLDDLNIGMKGDVNMLFSIPNSMLNAGMLVLPTPNSGYGWINWELFQQNLNLIKRMMGGGFQYEYNPRTKALKLIPDPIREEMTGWIVVGVNTIRPDTMQYGESWVRRYALAECKVILGTVRGKYSGVQLLGGGNLNPEILRSEGVSEKEKLMDELQTKEGGVYNFWVG